MLTKTKKKEVFLGLISSIFNDESNHINEDNCIQFYHFLLDRLENEAYNIPHSQRGYYVFLKQIIEILSSFDIFLSVKPDLEAVFLCKNKTRKLLLVFLQSQKDCFDEYFEMVRKIYASTKYEFLS